MKHTISFKRIRHFFEERIWETEHQVPWWKDLFLGFLRFIYLVLTGITKNKTAVRATALAYTTLLSIVPLIAVMLAFMKAFGGFAKIQDKLQPFILENLTTGSGQMVQQYLMEFTKNLHAGALGGVGIGFLVLTVTGLLSTIEAAFNDIWGIKNKRPFVRRLMAYWTLVTVGPLFVAVSIGSTASLQSSHLVQTYFFENETARQVLKITPYLMTWILFTMLYSFMPNTKVQFRSALLGGILAGTLWEFAKYGYTVYAAQSVEYSAIYGSLGALPVFLIWLYLTWVIVLIGAEVSFANQNITTYREERRTTNVSQEFKEFLALNLVAHICSHYQHEKGPVTVHQVTDDFKVPVRLVNEVLFHLCQAGVILEMGDEEHYYSPGKPMEQMTVKGVLDSVRSMGEDPSRLRTTRYGKYFEKILNDIDQSIFKISGHKTFKEIVSELSPAPRHSKK